MQKHPQDSPTQQQGDSHHNFKTHRRFKEIIKSKTLKKKTIVTVGVEKNTAQPSAPLSGAAGAHTVTTRSQDFGTLGQKVPGLPKEGANVAISTWEMLSALSHLEATGRCHRTPGEWVTR